MLHAKKMLKNSKKYEFLKSQHTQIRYSELLSPTDSPPLPPPTGLFISRPCPCPCPVFPPVKSSYCEDSVPPRGPFNRNGFDLSDATTMVKEMMLKDKIKKKPTFLLRGPPEIDPLPITLCKQYVSPDGPELAEYGKDGIAFADIIDFGKPSINLFFTARNSFQPDWYQCKNLSRAWNYSPLTTLKIICTNTYFDGLLWLSNNHPKTLVTNFKAIMAPHFGFITELPTLFYELHIQAHNGNFVFDDNDLPGTCDMDSVQQELVKTSVKDKAIIARKVVDKYVQVPQFRFFHDTVSQFFADTLINDLKHLESGDYHNISSAAHYCPSPASKLDRQTLLCENIARRVFPLESYPEYQGLEEVHYTYRVRRRLRKELLIPLRTALELHKQSGANLNLLPHHLLMPVFGFSGVVDKEVAELQWRRMVENLLNKHKLRNCIAVWLKDVGDSFLVAPSLGLLVSELSEYPWKGHLITCGEKGPQFHRIEGGTLEHKVQFLKRLRTKRHRGMDFKKVFEWILKEAIERNLSENQMVKKIFVFSCTWCFHDLFDDERKPTLYYWDDNYEMMQRRFEESGYQIPQIVFWNLNNESLLQTRDHKKRMTEMNDHKKGVTLVNGFSSNMVKLFLEEDDQLFMTRDAEDMMNFAIRGPEYDQLVVVD